MATQNQGSSMDQFDAYFRRADLDGDGRISGAEAVSFFQGSGLSKQVLAQIWMHADHSRIGFLNRQEFYNALKLVTVAQSKRDLTPDIVKAALFGPASSKIPPPQINMPPSPAGQSISFTPTAQLGATLPTASQTLGVRGSIPPSNTISQSTSFSPNPQLAATPSTTLQTLGPRGPTPPSNTISQSTSFAPNPQLVATAATSSQTLGPRVPPSHTISQSTSFAPNAQLAARASTTSQTLGPRGSVPSSNTISQIHYPAQGNQFVRPPGVTQATPVSSASRPPLQSTPVLPNAGISNDWLNGKAGGFTGGLPSQVPNRGVSPLVSSPFPTTQEPQPLLSQSIAKDSKASVSGNESGSNSSFGGDPFSALVPKQASSSATSSAPVSSAVVPTSSLPQPSAKPSSPESLPSALTKQPTGSHFLQNQALVHKPQQPQTSFSLSQAVPQATSGVVTPAISSGVENTPNQSQPPWPKMTAAGIQKYSKVFIDVDTDRDGKITGDQARNLFLSWKLPREVLKQVWDLAEQDNDSMLSLREFCIALYLMERFREGRPLPASLPNSIMFDETLMRLVGLPNSSYNNAAVGVTPGFRQVQGAPGSQQMPSVGGLRPQVPVNPHQAAGTRQFNQDRSSPLQLDNSQANQFSHVDQHSPEAIDAEKKEEKVEKIILDSKEKLEYYRTKMQDLVLYKSRCDNRLNEIIERASADKREAEMVGKKYEEKYKQVAELASKLTIEEATFRECQGRKMELHQAIINIEQGGSADGILQVRADRIQSELEELMKALAERCKKHGIEIKSAALIELPLGWQPGIPEGAAIWDEEWDKFEDEGLGFDKDPKADEQNATTASKPASFIDDMYPLDDEDLNADVKSEKHSSHVEHALDNESGYAHSEDDSARSPQGSPAHPASEFSDVFAKSEADNDFHRSFDDQGWGTFDGNDDVDSVWGFNANSKDPGQDRFESGSYGLSPIRTESPQAGSNYNKRSIFADSVPGTPFSKSANSPRYSEAGDSFFNNNYSGFDSFRMQDTQFSPPRETFSRFDSINSSKGDTFARFDSMNSSRGEAFGRFDSVNNSSRGFEHSRGFTSFDDADPFGSSGPFQVSSESKTPKKNTDSWSSF